MAAAVEVIAVIAVLIFISFVLPRCIVKLLTRMRLKKNPRYIVDTEKNKRTENTLAGIFELLLLFGIPMAEFIGADDPVAAAAELKDRFFGVSLLLLIISAVLLIIGFVNYKKRGFGVEPEEAFKKYRHMLRGSCVTVAVAIALFLVSKFIV